MTPSPHGAGRSGGLLFLGLLLFLGVLVVDQSAGVARLLLLSAVGAAAVGLAASIWRR